MSRVVKQSWDNIDLVVLENQDIEALFKWMNNAETNKFLWLSDIYYKEDIEKKYEDYVKDITSIYFSIYSKIDKKIIWICAIKDIVNLTLKSDLYIFIYDKKYHNKWYWTEVMKLLLSYGFDTVWLNKICLSYIQWNDAAKHIYTKLWFEEVWVFKNDVFVRWELKDQIYMEMYKEIYYKNKR